MTRHLIFLLVVALWSAADSWGQEAAKFDRSVKFAENFEGVIPRPQQDRAVAEKLASLKDCTLGDLEI